MLQPHHSPQRSLSRTQRAELRPLITTPYNPPPRRVFVSPVYQSPMYNTPVSGVSLSSPPVAGLRHYQRGQGMTTVIHRTPVARRSSAMFPSNHPRRHSSISSSSEVTTRMGQATVRSPSAASSSDLPQKRSRYKSIAEESRKLLLANIDDAVLADISGVVSQQRRYSTTQTTSTVTKAPLLVSKRDSDEYTHQRLRYWGHAYLGNIGTADVFVKAAYLTTIQAPVVVLDHEEATPKPIDPAGTSQSSVATVSTTVQPPEAEAKASKSTVSDRDIIVVRARVTPNSRDRKPFLIQRNFNLVELRASISPKKIDPTSSQAPDLNNSAAVTSMHTRAQSTPFPRPIESSPSKELKSALLQRVSSSAQKLTMPIHNEYALHYLPVLAALMLSGHIRKGYLIDLPLPHPEIWPQTVAWVYCGRVGEGMDKVGEAIRKNVRYLGGAV